MSPRNVTYEATEKVMTCILGRRIREARQLAGISLKALEEASEGGFKASVVGAYERGERHITAARLVILAGLLEAAPADLLGVV